MNILAALLAISIFFFLIDKIYMKFWDHNLTVHLHMTGTHVYEGEKLILKETVENRKLLPLPILKVKFQASKYFIFDNMENAAVSDNYYRKDILSVMPYQRLTRTLNFTCSHRGYSTIKKLDILCSNIFLTSESIETESCFLPLFVFPKQIETPDFEHFFRKMLGTVLTKRLTLEDPFEFRGIREYQSYDSMKYINWKASAKTGTLKVNEHNYTASLQVCILLNLEWIGCLRNEELEEESIRLAASLASRFISKGIQTSIYSNGKNIITEEAAFVPAGCGSHHMNTINEALAQINTNNTKISFPDILEYYFTNSANTSSDYVVIISALYNDLLLNSINSFKAQDIDYCLIIPKKLSDSAPAPDIENSICWNIP